MNDPKTYVECENCGRHLPMDSPPSKSAYDRGRIEISTGSVVLLSNAVVAKRRLDGVAETHAACIAGKYCNVDCLTAHIRRLRSEGSAKVRGWHETRHSVPSR